MTAEEMNVALYRKMQTEQQRFTEWLLTLNPEQILEHCYEFAVRENILIAMENNDLPMKSAAALLESKDVVSEVYEVYQKRTVGEITIAWECIEMCANKRLREAFIASRRKKNTMEKS